MKWHQLSYKGFMDPRWFNKIRNGKTEGIVLSHGVIELLGEKLYAININDFPHLSAGDTVIVKLTNFFYCTTHEEYQIMQDNHAKKQQEDKQKEVERLNKIRDEAERFNANLSVPVEWTAGIKDVLSGLTEKNGSGRNKKTVNHILLKSDLVDGRLVRKSGDFLCTNTSGTNGKSWSGQSEEFYYDGNGKPFIPKITCKSCLKIAERFNNKK